MIVASFDIGYKNLAFCIIKEENQEYNILEWKNINIFDNTINKGKIVFCQNSILNGNTCKSKAVYYDNLDKKFTCQRHIKNKENLEKLIFTENCDLPDLARLIIKILETYDFNKCTHIVIEQQLKVARQIIKNIFLIIMNYFILKYQVQVQKNIKIEMLNASHKLNVYDGPYIECKLKGQTARNKFYAEEYCKWFIRNNFNALNIFNSYKKKDDISDCFLQAVWYISKEKESIPPSSIPPSSILPSSIPPLSIPPSSIPFKLNLSRKIPLLDKKLSEIKQLDANIHINCDNNYNKYKNMKRTYKPFKTNKLYSLANIKYIIDRKGITEIEKDNKLKSAIEFFFINKENFLTYLNLKVV